MKVFCSTIVHETSRFSPIPTNLDSYREGYLYLPSTGEGAHWRHKILDDVDWSAIASRAGAELVFGPLASAQPGLPTGRADFALLKRELLDALERAMPVDAVLLQLHGAQVAEGTDDCEGEILAEVRKAVGRQIPIGVILDLHGNVSELMIANADIVLACLEYPHVDTPERAAQVAMLIGRLARGEIAPNIVWRRVPMLGTYFTTSSPMREFVDWSKSFEGKDGILAVSLMHGFAPADVSDCGGAVIICTGGDPGNATRIADEIAVRFFALRERIRVPRITAEEAVEMARKHARWPVVIADTTDNPGGGAAGDSTWLLRALIESGMSDCALGMIWDPVAAELAKRAGSGARLMLRIGGKTGPASGQPLDVEATVLSCRDDASQAAQGMKSPLGPAALIAVKGIRIVINSLRQQVFDPACFEAFGVQPRDCRIVVVKSHQHFLSRFGVFASKVIYATPPGTTNFDYPRVTFQNVPRPIYPLDQPPFRAFGRMWSA